MNPNDKSTAEACHVARLNKIIFFWPNVLIILGIILNFYMPQLNTVALFCIFFAIAWNIATWITYYFSSLTIKKQHVILRTGFLIKNTVDIPMAKIESIDIRQSIIGSIFGYGTLIITGTGGTRQFIPYLNNPLTCRRYIEQLLSA